MAVSLADPMNPPANPAGNDEADQQESSGRGDISSVLKQ
jgi:hypothetical protein